MTSENILQQLSDVPQTTGDKSCPVVKKPSLRRRLDLTGIVDSILCDLQGETICFNDITKSIERRGFGPLLFVPAFLVLLPTGAIPGVPALAAVIICLIAGQIVLGRKSIYIPKKLEEFRIGREKFTNLLEKVRPYTKKIDRFLHPRLGFLTHPVTEWFVAFLSIILAVMMIPMAVIPFAVMLPALAICLFALALSVKDGVLTLMGLATIGAMIHFIPDIITKISGWF